MKRKYESLSIKSVDVALDSPIADSNWVYYDNEGNYVGMGGGWHPGNGPQNEEDSEND